MSETTGSTHKLISCFHGQSKSKNVAARELTARYIEQTLMIISPQRALADTRDLTEKIILSMISALNDSAHETRQYGKRIVVLLAKYEHFEAICGKYLSSEDNRKGMWVSKLRIWVGFDSGNSIIEFKRSTCKEYVFGWISRPTYVISLSPQAK